MFDKYVIVDDSLRKVDGGYEVKARIPYYRGLGLSMVDVDLTVDGHPVAPEDVTFTVHDNSYRSDQMGEIYDDRWGFTEPATLTVAAPEGLEPGPHDVELQVRLRVSYNPYGSGATDRKTLVVA